MEATKAQEIKAFINANIKEVDDEILNNNSNGYFVCVSSSNMNIYAGELNCRIKLIDIAKQFGMNIKGNRFEVELY